MVTLGKIPDTVQAPFVRITPAVDGSFRWSGTTILIFTPQRPLPFSTNYEVTVDTTATAVSGRKLEKPVDVPVHDADRAARSRPVVPARRHRGRPDRADAALQSAGPRDGRRRRAVGTLRAAPHGRRRRLRREQVAALKAADPTSLDRFNAKVKQTQLAAASRAPVTLQPTTDWNQDAFKPAPELLAFEVVTDVAPEGWLRLSIAGTVRSPAGPATPGARADLHGAKPRRRSSSTASTAPRSATRISAIRCVSRTKVNVEEFAKATTVVDAATGKPIARPAAAPDKPSEEDRDVLRGIRTRAHARRCRLPGAAAEPQDTSSPFATI